MQTPMLETGRLFMRPVLQNDLDTAFREWFGDDEVAKYMFWQKHDCLEQTQTWLDYEQSMVEADNWYRFIVCLKDNEKTIVGSVLLYIDEEILDWEIAYHFGKKYWAMGYATEAVRKVLEFAHQALKIHRIAARYACANRASRKVLKKTGFHKKHSIDYWICDHRRKVPGEYYEWSVEIYQ